MVLNLDGTRYHNVACMSVELTKYELSGDEMLEVVLQLIELEEEFQRSPQPTVQPHKGKSNAQSLHQACVEERSPAPRPPSPKGKGGKGSKGHSDNRRGDSSTRAPPQIVPPGQNASPARRRAPPGHCFFCFNRDMQSDHDYKTCQPRLDFRKNADQGNQEQQAPPRSDYKGKSQVARSSSVAPPQGSQEATSSPRPASPKASRR